jgi:hypothetical protein
VSNRQVVLPVWEVVWLGTVLSVSPWLAAAWMWMYGSCDHPGASKWFVLDPQEAVRW